MKNEKISMIDIRQDLKFIQKYYIHKKQLDNAETIEAMHFIYKIKIYNQLIRFAPPMLCLLYKSLYIEGHTQESLAAKSCYAIEYISKLNLRLISFFYNIMNTKDFVI